jgi:hypothetical protein
MNFWVVFSECIKKLDDLQYICVVLFSAYQFYLVCYSNYFPVGFKIDPHPFFDSVAIIFILDELFFFVNFWFNKVVGIDFKGNHAISISSSVLDEDLSHLLA